MNKFEKEVLAKLDTIIALLPGEEISGKEETKPLELKDHNFRINSKGWKKNTVDGEKYLVNLKKDVWEITEGECKGEQLFTWDAAMRETKKAGKRMPSDEEFTEILKAKDDIKNLKLAGNRGTDGSFGSRASDAYVWSSSQSSASNAWDRGLSSGYASVSRDADAKAFGFSVRCLKD